MKAKNYDIVKNVLEEYPICRSNMNALYSAVLIKKGLSTNLLDLMNSKEKISFEAIARARRKIVEGFPELKGSKEVEEERINATKEYIQFALNGWLE